MITNRRQARNFLNDSSRATFWSVVNEAKISDEDQRVLDLKFIHGRRNVQIALELNMSVDNVNKIIARSYSKIAKLIQ